MNIASIGASQLAQMSASTNVTKSVSAPRTSFGSFVRDTIDSVNKSQQAAEREIASAVTGDQTDLHRTIIALQSADLQFQFALQVRNKLIDAYQEIMRMQV